MPQNKEEEERNPDLLLSLTPGAAQVKVFFDDKPCEYPCTPQHFAGNPLAAYAANLTDDAVFGAIKMEIAHIQLQNTLIRTMEIL